MIDSDYKKKYEDIFVEFMRQLKQEEYYDTALLSYMHKNKLMGWLFWKRVEAALTLAGDVKGKKVLDFGCGAGITFKFLADNQCELYGCDIKSGMLAKNVADILDVKVHISKELSELAEHKFDVIFALDVLEHIDDLALYLQKFRRISHAKTKIIISGPSENFMYRCGRRLSGFAFHDHVRNIFDIEGEMAKEQFKLAEVKDLYYPISLFRVSKWHLG